MTLNLDGTVMMPTLHADQKPVESDLLCAIMYMFIMDFFKRECWIIVFSVSLILLQYLLIFFYFQLFNIS